MSENSSIEWTDHTFNPWWGCTKISPGCDNCYAEAIARRFGTGWGADAERRTFWEEHWLKPIGWNAKAVRQGRRFRVFCASMADVFDNREGLDDERAELWRVIASTPNLDWQLLTKRVGNIARMVPAAWLEGAWPANAWLGISVVNQEEADRDVPKLVALPAWVRFLSCEPLLGPIDLVEAHALGRGAFGHFKPSVQWVITGGESGPKARPAHPDWFRSLRDQCAAAGVPFLFKQWGEWAPHQTTAGGDEGGDLRRGHVRYLESDGREPDGHFRRGDAAVARIGKKAAGRTLDGAQHDAMPA